MKSLENYSLGDNLWVDLSIVFIGLPLVGFIGVCWLIISFPALVIETEIELKKMGEYLSWRDRYGKPRCHDLCLVRGNTELIRGLVYRRESRYGSHY